MNDNEYMVKRFDDALYAIPSGIKELLLSLPSRTKAYAEEIRIRAEKPLILTVNGAPMWVGSDKRATLLPPREPVYVTSSQVQEIYLNLCNRSVYSHFDEIKDGYIMMSGGHRAGICGTVFSDGVRDISSINIRISKECPGCADRIVSHFDGGMLIAGPPGSGKTTLLRDAVRQLSTYHHRRITVIDSRGEIAAMKNGSPQNSLGDNTDVITGVDKVRGIEIALRVMYPQIIAFDEISSQGEVELIIKGLFGGASVITTAHVGSPEDLARRDVTRRLLQSGAINTVAVLEKVGGDIKFIGAEKVIGG